MIAEVPLVSVIVPVYNARRYLAACVQSLRAQDEQNIEIILVDDGSTDGSGALCDRFAARDNRIVVCHQKNGGVSAARNRGLELARGRYIMFCDSDDTVLPRYCGNHLRAVSQPGVALTIAMARLLPRELEGGENGCRPDYRLLLRLWEERWLWYCWGKCFDGDIIRRAGLRFDREITHGEDTLFVVEYIMELLERPGQIYLWRERLYRYYDTPGSLAKDQSAMARTLEWKSDAARKLCAMVGVAPEELEDFLLEDRVHIWNNTFRAGIWQSRRPRTAQVRSAMQTPEFYRMLMADRRLRVFGERYRKILNSGSPLIIASYLSAVKKKNQLCSGWLAQRFLPRKILE